MHIALEDQQKINRFARLNNRMEDLKEELAAKKADIQTLEDASTDLMMLEDDEERVSDKEGCPFLRTGPRLLADFDVVIFEMAEIPHCHD